MGVTPVFLMNFSLCFSQGEYWWINQVLCIFNSTYFIANKVAGASVCDVSTICDYAVAAHMCVHNIMGWCNATVGEFCMIQHLAHQNSNTLLCYSLVYTGKVNKSDH